MPRLTPNQGGSNLPSRKSWKGPHSGGQHHAYGGRSLRNSPHRPWEAAPSKKKSKAIVGLSTRQAEPAHKRERNWSPLPKTTYCFTSENPHFVRPYTTNTAVRPDTWHVQYYYAFSHTRICTLALLAYQLMHEWSWKLYRYYIYMYDIII